jgi:hypothetical protein
MKPSPALTDSDQKTDRSIEVPRDTRPDSPPDDNPPATGSRQMLDEDYAPEDKPLAPDSAAARALQDHPPKGEDQLTTGSGGDAARPGKDGIFAKPIPPRGRM